MSITLIGDVHGKYDKYHKILRQHQHTIQVGDFGFDYETLLNVDSKHHVIVAGNHDNYDKIKDIPHYLGDFGYVTNFHGIDFFFYRGAYSIDMQNRTIGIDWWQNEQINIEGFTKAKELYGDIKPDIMITHDCPESLYQYLLPAHARIYQNNTSFGLQELFNIHQPKIWRFGHMHQSWRMNINGTDFKCLNELETEII